MDRPNPTTARLIELGKQRDLIAELVPDNPEAAQRAMDKITEEMTRLLTRTQQVRPSQCARSFRTSHSGLRSPTKELVAVVSDFLIPRKEGYLEAGQLTKSVDSTDLGSAMTAKRERRQQVRCKPLGHCILMGSI
jgi:hypothetical protein